MKQYQQPSFRGVQFYCQDTSNTFGRRIAYHEYPLFDKPYAEDMGRKGRKFDINGFVIGDNWESQRDALIKACEAKGAGLLIHPDIGSINVVCDTCTVTESKVDAGLMAVFQMTFYETGENTIGYVSPNAAVQLRDSAGPSLLQMATQALSAFNFITALASIDNASHRILSLLSLVVPPALVSTVNALANMKGQSVKNPYHLISAISTFTSTLNNDYSTTGTALDVLTNSTPVASYNYKKSDTQTYKFTIVDADSNNITDKFDAKRALDTYIEIVNTPIVHIAAKTPATTMQQKITKTIEVIFKTFAVVEATVASSNIKFASLADAQEIWNNILAAYDNVERLAEEIDLPITSTLREMRAALVADIKQRAPTLANRYYKKINDVTPAIAIAYDQYEDVSREIEIINRNKLKHPGFVLTERLELLVK